MKTVQNSDGGDYATSQAPMADAQAVNKSLPAGTRAGLDQLKAVRQLCLDFGPEHVHDLIHGQHQARVVVAHKEPGKWFQKSLENHEAREYAIAVNGFPDVYQSMNGFAERGRTLTQVRALTCCFVDLDTYTVPGLAGVSADDLLTKACRALPWLPVPTAVFNSGRGVYFSWVFDAPLLPELLPQWQAVQNALVEVLEPFGADPLAKDASRVLRIVGTVNSKNGETVTAHETGQRLKFERLQCAVLDAVGNVSRQQDKTGAQAAGEDAQGPKRSATAKQKAQAINPYKLALDRMEDYRTLVRLRAGDGGRLGDYRHRLLFCYAVSVAWYRPSRAAVIEECRAFILEHFKDPDKYRSGRIGKILEGVDQKGIPKIWNGKRVTSRYRLRNSTILKWLEITPAEQKHMRTLIAKPEKDQRRIEKARKAGVVERSVYLANAEDKRRAILELNAKGMSSRDIAEGHGISRRHVNRIIRKAYPDMFDVLKPKS